jgi:hypothetical protein
MAYFAHFDELRTFGVEIECFGAANVAILRAMGRRGIECAVIDHTDEVQPTWRLSKDNSIEGEAPIEVVSPVLSGREGLIEVAKVLEALRSVGCEVNSSCGFHVHWNCGDFTGKNMLSLLRFYAKFESVIDRFVDPSRRGNLNRTCWSMVKDDDLSWVTRLDPTEQSIAAVVAARFEMAYHETEPEHRTSRYHKVNVQAYPMYGTVEFRQCEGTLETEKAIHWIVLTQQFVNKAKAVAVSRNMSAKPTLGEFLRSLKMVDFHIFGSGEVDPLILELAEYLKKTYMEMKETVNEWSDLALQEA